MQKIIRIEQGVCRMPQCRLAAPVDFELCDGEHLAIVGLNASGKSMLVNMMVGRYPLMGVGATYDFSPSQKKLVSDNIKYITFQDAYDGTEGYYYYQIRYNAIYTNQKNIHFQNVYHYLLKLKPNFLKQFDKGHN